jgi:hypothetical protein
MFEMKKLLCVSFFILSACGVDKAIDSVNATPEKMDEMSRKMGEMQQEMNKTNESIRLQKVAIAKENLEDPQNAKVLLPIPVGLMGYAKLFSENATTDEITGQIYLYLKEINDGLFMKPVDTDGNEIEFTAQQVADINQAKLQKYTAAQAICGLLPQEVVEALVNNYVLTEDRYQKTVLNILMMRFQFLRDVMLNASLLSESIEDVGSIEKAYEYISYMDWIARRPFIGKVQVKVTGFLPPYGEFYEDITTNSAQQSLTALYETVLQRAKAVEKVQQSSVSGNAELDKTLFAERTARLETVLEKTRERVAYWKKVSP